VKVKDIGEQGLLERLQRFCPAEIIGDDAAVISSSPEQSLVVTTDMLPLVQKMWGGDRLRLTFLT
jgi:thiamine-monophosphate kinase